MAAFLDDDDEEDSFIPKVKAQPTGGKSPMGMPALPNLGSGSKGGLGLPPPMPKQ